MRSSFTGLKRLSGVILEVALGLFVVGLLVAALHPGKVEAKSVKPAAGALQQGFTGTTICIQDDSNGNFLTFEPGTGNYTWTACKAPTLTLSGTGVVQIKGCVVTLTHNAVDRRLLATVDFCTMKAKASLNFGGLLRTIADRNIKDDTCVCGAGSGICCLALN